MDTFIKWTVNKYSMIHWPCELIFIIISYIVGWDSSVGISACYRLDGLGIVSWGGGCPTPIQTIPGAHPASYTVGTGSFSGVKQWGHGVDHPPPSSAMVKE